MLSPVDPRSVLCRLPSIHVYMIFVITIYRTYRNTFPPTLLNFHGIRALVLMLLPSFRKPFLWRTLIQQESTKTLSNAIITIGQENQNTTCRTMSPSIIG